jgi:branched-chain amino acid transport system substrate-binding protein
MAYSSSTRRRYGALAAVASLSIVVSGCGSDDGGGGGSSDEAIKIMGIGLFQSAALSLPDAQAAMEAKVAQVNADGGIDGRQIDLIICNNNLDPNTAAGCARQAIEEEVVAVVASFEPFTSQVVPTLEQAQIPFFHGEPITENDATSEIEFAMTGGVLTQYAALGKTMADAGCSRVGIIASSDEVVQVGAEFATKAFESSGGSAVQIDVPIEQAAFDSEVAQLVADGAECIIPAANPPQGASIVKTVNGLPEPMPVGGISSEFPPTALETLGPDADLIVIADQMYLPTDDVEAIATIKDAMAEYTPDQELYEAFGVLGWATMTAALATIDEADEKTTEGILEAAQGVESVDSGGVLAEFGWAEDGPVSQYPGFTNWNYLSWTVSDGVAVLDKPEFTELTGIE